MQPTSVQLTANSLEIFNDLISLNISGTRIDENIAGCLAKALGSNLQLEQLYMNKCQITSPTIKQICHQLKQLHTFNRFETNENFIGDEATEKMAMAILHWNFLEHIELVENDLSPQAILLLEMLMKDMGSEMIINFVNNHYVVKTFIKVLDYASNNSGERVTQFLSNLMKVTEMCLQVETPLEMTLNASRTLQRLRNITSFNIRGIVITEQVANNLCHIFDNNKASLKQLIMNACELTSNKTLKFIDQLRFASKITEAEFCNNEIGDDDIMGLVIAVLHWNALHTLKLENNCFTKNSKEIFEILKDFSKSPSTCIDYNGKVDKIFPFVSLLGCMNEVDDMNSVLVAKVTKIEKLLLDCSGQNNTSEQFEINASRFFTRFGDLTDLNISGMMIGEEVADNLAKGFGSNFECLIMNNCQLTSKIALKLTTKLRNCLGMRKLSLCNNLIDDNIMVTQALIVSIFHWNNFEDFKFEGNQFNKQSKLLFRILLSQLKFSDLSLNLSGTFDDLTSFITLLGYMKDIPADKSCFVDNISKVHHIDLTCSEQQAELPVCSSEGFQIFNHLISLNINGLIIKENAAGCLAKVFCNNLQLERLFMNKCQISSSTINVLCRQLKFNSLKTFELSENFIDDKAMEELAITILHWNLLESIKLEQNWFSTQGIFLLNMLTNDLESEVIINFVNNDFVLTSFIKVLDYASKNTGKGVKQFLNNFRKVTEMSLRAETSFDPKAFNFKLPCVDIDKLSVCLPSKQLRMLELNGIYFTSNYNITIFNDCISKLQKLMLINCKLDSTSTVRLFSHRQQSPAAFQELTNLDLSNNFIGKDVVNSLVNSILRMPKLTAFRAVGNQVGNYLDTIFRIILDWKSAKLSVKYYKTSDVQGTDHISAFFAILSSAKDISRKDSCQINNIIKINKLVLKNLRYTVPLLNKDVSCFIKRLTNLQELNLTGIFIKQSAISVINDALTKDLASLQILVLCKCTLNSDLVKTLLFFTRNAIPVAFNKLTIVDFSHNLMDDNALKPLVNSFLQIQNLQKLHLCKNNFTNIMPILTILYDWRDCKHLEFNYSNRHDSRAYTSAFFTLVSFTEDAIFEGSFFVKNITAVNSLSLANHDHNNPIILTESLAMFFQRFTNLTEVNLSGIHIHKKAIRSIGRTLQNLLKLKFSHCQLDSDFVKTMFYPGGRSIILMNLIELDLSFNNIDNKANSVLIHSLIEMPKLKTLKVTGNKFSRSDERAFNSVLSEFSTYKSSINYNNADNSTECIEAFLILLSAINNTTERIRKCNQIQNITRVEELHLHSKQSLELSKEASLFFQEFSRLTTLNLSGICIKTSVSKNLAKALQNNHRFLQILVLSQCKLDYESVLNLFGINTDGSAMQLSKASIKFQNLSTLDISNNFIKNDAAHPLITLFLQMPKLVELNIDGNYFSEETFTALEFLFAFNKSINIIDSSNSTICRYRPKNNANSFLQKLNGKTYYGALLHYDYSFINLYCLYNRTIMSYKPPVYALAFIDLLECAKNVKSIQVRNILKLEKLILDFTCVEQKDTATLSKDAFRFLTSLPNLKELKLIGVSVNTDSETVTVEKFSSLQKLTLAKCCLSSEATMSILSLLNKCTVTDLCLSHNHITCKAGNAINEFVYKNNILIDIDLSYNEFEDKGATIIVQSLNSCSNLNVTGFEKTRLSGIFYISRNTILKYSSHSGSLMPNCRDARFTA